MSKWIRWKGLIPFVAVVAMFAVFFVFYADIAIRKTVELAGTGIVGAKVELDSAKFSFQPLGVKLNRLQVTNPDEPMRNAVEIKHMNLSLDGAALLRRKVIIENMRMDGLRLNTARKSSGALPKTVKSADSTPAPQEQKKDEEEVALPAFDTPDVNEILSREPLKTEELADAFQQQVDDTEKSWAQLEQSLPDQKRMDGYGQRFDAARSVNTKDLKAVRDAINDLKQLRKDISADIESVKKARKQVSNDVKKLETDFKALKDAPKEDYERIVGKYTLSDEGLANISHLLFGPQIREYTRLALHWYRRLEPYLSTLKSEESEPQPQRATGINVRFKEFNPIPDFLIKTIHASVQIEAGEFEGSILNVTAEQHITGKPTTLKFVAEKLKGIKSIKLTGNFDHIRPEQAVDTIKFSMNEYDMEEHTITHTDDIKVRFADAKSTTDVVAVLKNGKLEADLNANFHSIVYNNEHSNNDMAKLLSNAISDVSSFNITGELSGTLDDLDTNIKSDLDQRLSDALKARTDELVGEFKQELRDKVDAKTREPIEQAREKLDTAKNQVEQELDKRKQEMDQRIADVKQKLAELEKKVDDKKQNAKDKAKNQLKDKLKKLF